MTSNEKNAYLLSTEKGTGVIAKSPKGIPYLVTNHNKGISDHIDKHIYITDNKDYIGLSWYIDGDLIRKGVVDDRQYWSVRPEYNKIILTTDPKLIEDGVEEIDDEFIEWFVKNPCDTVEVYSTAVCEYCGREHCDDGDCNGHPNVPYHFPVIPEKVETKTVRVYRGYEISEEFKTKE